MSKQGSAVGKALENLLSALASVEGQERVEWFESIRKSLHVHSPLKDMPVNLVQWVPIEEVEANDYNPNSVATNEMKLLYTSIKHDGYCVEESTPILMADLTWKPAGRLLAGEKIIAFDEEATGEGDGRKQRRYRTAYVVSNSVERSELVSVETDRGVLLTTPDHPFLCKRRYGKGHYVASWVEAKDLRPEDIVIHVMQPWTVDRSFDAGWLSGFLDGEGTCAKNQVKSRALQTVRLSGYQRPSPTADRMILEMSKRAITKVFTVKRPNGSKWNDMVMCRVDRMTEVMRLLGSVRPERLIASAGEFWEGSALSGKLESGSSAIVRSVTKADSGNIARLSTSTKTYIANGFAVHNTQPVVVIFDPEKGKYVIVDGFHRYTTMRLNADIRERTGGRLPVVVLEKSINDRMASTIRHNRARGKHSVTGTANIVFKMLEEGWPDDRICAELGMSADELIRVKHVTGFSKLFENVEYRNAWETRRQIKLRAEWVQKNGPDQPAPSPAAKAPAKRKVPAKGVK